MMRFCPFCGAKLLPDAKFCGNCGRNMPTSAKSERDGCYICGKQELLPFTCSYCQRVFCSRHRLPENHDCPGLSQSREAPWAYPPQAKRANSTKKTAPQYYTFRYGHGSPYPPPTRRRDEFIPPPGMEIVTFGSEVRDLAVGAALIAFFVFGIFFWRIEELTPIDLILAILGALLASGTAFICHELAHRYFAIRAGMQARFVLWRQGLYLTVFMIALAFFTGLPAIAAPGFVLIQGFADRETNGKISAAGPSINIFFGLIFLIISLPFASSTISEIFRLVAALNGILALFNLIPIGNLDGKKIMNWNGAAWILLVVLGLVIFIGATFIALA